MFQEFQKTEIKFRSGISYTIQRVFWIYFQTFSISQFAYLTPPPTSTTHNIFNMSKAVLSSLKLEVKGVVVEEPGAKSNTETNKKSQFVKSM